MGHGCSQGDGPQGPWVFAVTREPWPMSCEAGPSRGPRKDLSTLRARRAGPCVPVRFTGYPPACVSWGLSVLKLVSSAIGKRWALRIKPTV